MAVNPRKRKRSLRNSEFDEKRLVSLIARRIEEIDSGKVELISWDEARKLLKSQLAEIQTR